MAALLTSLGISIHAPREGGDLIHDYSIFALSIISIHAPREGGDDDLDDSPGGTRISIHAPREGGDCRKNEPHGQQQPISIHAPREGGDSASV